MHDVMISLGKDFLKAFAALPKAQQKKTQEFIEKFQENPASSGINLEKFQSSDENMRSVRIDREYRGIVLKAPQGNLFILLWVDLHDRAYEWGQSKRVSVNPITGALQMYDIDAAASHVAHDPVEVPSSTPRLFDHVKDRELVTLGVPEPLLPLVRALVTESDLDGVSVHLPEEAAEALYGLAAGMSYEETWAAVQEHAAADANREDFAAALRHPDALRRFTVVTDAAELQEVLDAPLEHWRVFLHPSQRQVVGMQANGPMRVLGGAGTGKTVAAMHRVKWLLDSVVTDPAQRVLVTTFTRNLAIDIRENLRQLCCEEELSRVEVINIDAWADTFLRGRGWEYVMHFHGDHRAPWEDALNMHRDALRLPDSFYREEWEQVIQEQAIRNLEDYLKASRTGRGVRLSETERRRIWPLFEEYRDLLERQGRFEPDDVLRECRLLLERSGEVLPYRAVVIDEAQDMKSEVFRLVRAMLPPQPNDIFITGDPHQRIYGRPIVLGQCGIEIRGRSRFLRVNYRTTEETRRWAVSLLRGVTFDDLDGSEGSQDGYRSLLHGEAPVCRHFDTFREEIEYIRDILDGLKERQGHYRNACLVLRTKSVLDKFAGAFEMLDIAMHPLGRDAADDRSSEGVRIATMHRVKGLEFEYMIIASINAQTMPLKWAVDGAGDDESRRHVELMERSLLYVAATRAKKQVYITGSGKESPFMR
ncbi:MAG: AAA family ATPase [Bacteroidetes bacterium]|nr:AAA family ATPase [Bacteroidota bacterium]